MKDDHMMSVVMDVNRKDPTFVRCLVKVVVRFNQICLTSTGELVRVIGFHEDERDYYWIVKDMFGRQSYHSYVGDCISLKPLGVLDYNNFEQLFELNGSPAEKEILITSEVKDENSPNN